jgi:leucyl-tRNA synthetase
MDYGTGAIMGVPAHDARDLAFATRYELPTRVVIEEERGILVNSGEFNGLSIEDAKKRIASRLKELKAGGESLQFRMRDWLVSRQRYWGVPIPFVYCKTCGIEPLREEDLPLILPEKLSNPLSLKSGNPLIKEEAFRKVKCPSNGEEALRETDTLDTFFDSSWYFLRFADPWNDQEIFSRKAVEKWLPVDAYIGGMEHAIMHLLYARFIHKFLYKHGYLSKESSPEPFKQLITQGLVKGKTFKVKETGAYVKQSEVKNYTEKDLAVSFC